MRIVLVERAPWFGALGQPWTGEDRSLAERYAAACGGTVLTCESLAAAAAFAGDPAGNAAFDDDTREARRLHHVAVERIGADAVTAGLDALVDAALEPLGERAISACALDATTARALAGAAALALHRGALAALAAGDSVGDFTHRFGLAEAGFARGRWFLGRAGTHVAVL